MNFGKVSGKGMGVGLSQRMFEPLLHELSGHPGSLYFSGRVEERTKAILSWYLGLGWGCGHLGFAQLACGQPSHPGNPMNSVVMSGTLDDECVCGKKTAKDCLPCVLLSGEPLMCSK